MAEFDTSMYAQAAGPAKSYTDYQNEALQLQQNKLALMMGRQKADAYTQQQNELNSVREYMRNNTDPNAPGWAAGGYAAGPTQFGPIDSQFQARQKTAAEAGHLNAQTSEVNQKAIDLAYARYKDNIGSVQDPTEAAAVIAAAYHDPIVGPVLQQHGSLVDGLRRLQEATKTPEDFLNWRAGAAINIGKLAELAKVNTADFGGTKQTQVYQPATGQFKTVASAPVTQSPDNAATQAGEDRRANARLSAEFGIGANGKLDDNSERTAQGIASGQLPAPTGMALLNPKNQKILGRVMEINPTYDFTEVAAKKKAAADFTSGTLGNSMRSFAVAGQHLDQLGTLVDALNNQDNQTVNKVGNAISTWNGATPVTDFNAAKDVVAKEVMKAIIAGGGGQAEREELAKALSSANSSAQLKGVIKQYRNLMGAQHDALLQQRRAAGLPDSTLPKYGETAPDPNAALHSAADAIISAPPVRK